MEEERPDALPPQTHSGAGISVDPVNNGESNHQRMSRYLEDREITHATKDLADIHQSIDRPLPNLLPGNPDREYGPHSEEVLPYVKKIEADALIIHQQQVSR